MICGRSNGLMSGVLLVSLMSHPERKLTTSNHHSFEAVCGLKPSIFLTDVKLLTVKRLRHVFSVFWMRHALELCGAEFQRLVGEVDGWSGVCH